MDAARNTPGTSRSEMVLVGVLLAVTAIVFGKNITVGGLRYSDACTHAMDGVLLHDWVRAGPAAWVDPVGFATQQYAHLPTLGIGRVYPPGFAVVEAVFFAVLGISAPVARSCVAVFGLGAVAACYLLMRRLASPAAAVVSALCLAGMPGVVFWTRQTMLEMPTLAVLLWCAWAAARYVERPTWGRWAAVTVLTLAAPMFKQTAGFMVPALGVFFLGLAWQRRLPSRQFAAWAACVTVLLGTFYGYSLGVLDEPSHLWRVITRGEPSTPPVGGAGRAAAVWAGLSYYPRQLPEQSGAIVAVLALLGALLTLRHRGRVWTFIWLWTAAFFAMSLLIQHKEPRYLFFGLAPVALWAGLAAERLLGRIPWRGPRIAGWVLLGLFLAGSGYRAPTRLEPDYTSLVETHAAELRGQLVLFEGHRDGDFTFAVRRVLGPRGCVVLRASKLFYSCASDKRFEFASYVSSIAQVAGTIDELGIATIVVERRNVLDLAETRLLHEELDDAERYERLATHNLPHPRSGQQRILDVYRRKNPPPRTRRHLDLPIPIAGRTIRIDLDAPRIGS